MLHMINCDSCRPTSDFQCRGSSTQVICPFFDPGNWVEYRVLTISAKIKHFKTLLTFLIRILILK